MVVKLRNKLSNKSKMSKVTVDIYNGILCSYYNDIFEEVSMT